MSLKGLELLSHSIGIWPQARFVNKKKTCFFTFLIVPETLHYFWTSPLYPKSYCFALYFIRLRNSLVFSPILKIWKSFFFLLLQVFCIPNKNWMKKFLSSSRKFVLFFGSLLVLLTLGLTLRSRKPRKPIMDLITPLLLLAALWWSWTTFLCW